MLTEFLSYPLVAVLFLLGVLVFVHEFGHYITAKIFHVGVETFSFGFGPVLISKKFFGTLFQVALIPLGGFVKLAGSYEGEPVPEEYEGTELFRAAPWKKILILLAGPAFNFFLAAFIYASLFSVGFKKLESVVGLVKKESPAEQAGLLSGDRLLSLGGKSFNTWEDMSKLITESPGKELDVTYDRFGQEYKTKITPETFFVPSHKGGEEAVGRIGIAPIFWPPIVSVSALASVAYRLGLRTGDFVQSVTYKENGSEMLLEEKISAWHELEFFLVRMLNKNLANVSLQVKRSSDSELVSIPLELTSEEKNNSLLLQDPSLFTSFLGLRSSELTVSFEDEKKSSSSLLKNHDILISFQGKMIRDIFDLEKALEENKSSLGSLTVFREGKEISFDFPLKALERQLPSGRELFYVLDVSFLAKGISLPYRVEKAESLFAALSFGIAETYNMSLKFCESLWGLLVGRVPLASLGGPLLIAKTASESIKMGFEVFFMIMALISINLGIVNLVPIPLLDGGRIVIVTIEWVRGKTLSLEALENFQKIGFVLVFSLFILAMYNDLSRFWASAIQDFVGMGK